MKKVIVLPHQSLYDLALQEYGSVEGAIQILEDNSSINGEDEFVAEGTVLLVDETKVIDTSVVNYYRNRNIIPANV